MHAVASDHSVRRQNNKITIALIANANREREAAVVIWKSESPRCLKGGDRSKLPV